MVKEVWVVVGTVTDPDSLHYGETEYQFSDGPPGERGSSADYISLTKGLKDHSGCVIHWDKPDSLSGRLEEAVSAQHAWFWACEALKQAEAALVAAKDAYSRSVDALMAETGPDERDEVMAKYHDRCLVASRRQDR